MRFVQTIKQAFGGVVGTGFGTGKATKWLAAGALGLVTLAAPAVTQASDRDGRRDDDRRGNDRRDDDRRGRDYDRRDNDRRDYDRGPRVGIDIRIGDPRPVFVRPAPVRVWVGPVYRTVSDRRWVEPVYRSCTDRVWVPDVFEDREERWYEHGRVHTRTTRVLVVAGHFENRDRRECVTEGRWETFDRQECVTEGRWEYR